jgi:hypothetical protein
MAIFSNWRHLAFGQTIKALFVPGTMVGASRNVAGDIVRATINYKF